MTVTKKELVEINEDLLQALQGVKAENVSLQRENAFLKLQLSKSERCVTRLSEQYRRLNNYIRMLRDWLDRREKKP